MAMSQILILPIVLVANNICNLVHLFHDQISQVLLKFILFQVSGGWISQNYNQLSQAKVKAETEFGNMLN